MEVAHLVTGSNIATASIFKGEPMLGAYVAAKGGVDTLTKIAEHGKRADSIVKNMLLHSREGPSERQRVALARALVNKPEVLLLDERSDKRTGCANE